MTAPNFSSILDESPTEVARPQPAPVGTYLCVVTGQPNMGESTKKKTPFVEFQLKPIQAADDVDPEELAVYLERVGELSAKPFKHTIYLTEANVYRLDEFHQACGLDMSDGATRKQRNDAVINSQVLVYYKHRPSDRGDMMFGEIGSVSAVE